MDNYYDSIAEGYEELHREEQEKKIALIRSILDEYFIMKDFHNLLDVGCGTGITTIPWPCKRTGLDPARKLLEKANKKKEVSYVLGRAENIPFEDNSFEIVTSITAIQNFEDIRKGLREIRRVGKDFFILSYLKKSQKSERIESIMEELFTIVKRIEEDKDIIFFASKKQPHKKS